MPIDLQQHVLKLAQKLDKIVAQPDLHETSLSQNMYIPQSHYLHCNEKNTV